MLPSRKDHNFDVSDKSTDASVDFSYRYFFKIMIFLDRFRQSFKLFKCFEKQLFMDFLKFFKNTQEKQRDGVWVYYC